VEAPAPQDYFSGQRATGRPRQFPRRQNILKVVEHFNVITSMSLLTSIQKCVREPLNIIGALWAVVLLMPFAPGLPKPSLGGLPWRQELFLAFLFSVTFFFLLLKGWRSRESFISLRPNEWPVLLPLVLFILWSAASALWATAVYPALHHTFVWTAYALFFVLMRRVAERPRLLRTSLLALASVIFILSLSCMIEFWGAPDESGVRTVSLFRFFNGFGEMLSVSIPLFAALALKLRRTRAALLCGATAIAAWLAMLQALERAPIIGASVALIALALLSLFFRSFRPHSLRRAALLLAAFALVTALQVLPSPLTEGHSSAAARLQATSASEPNTRVRFLFWGIGLEMLRERPVTGVGANNYDAAYPQARAQFSLRHPASPLIAMHEEMIVERAHNEYVQILAELGIVGFSLFLTFCCALMFAAWRALRDSKSALVPGACCSLLAFALSSGASSASFRWMGGGLLFFFAAAIVSRAGASAAPSGRQAVTLSLIPARVAIAGAFALALLMFGGRCAQGVSTMLHGAAQGRKESAQAEQLYRNALRLNPLDATTHLDFGLRLYAEKRAGEAMPHLRYALERGMNTSVCYAYLAAAEAGSNDTTAAAATMAQAVNVYPRSVFLRVRHAAALKAVGRAEEAEKEFAVAVSLDSRTARGWQELMSGGADRAKAIAYNDKSVAMPGELYPENCILMTIAEYENTRSELAAKAKTDR
jgi:O-antigen ligase